MIVRNNITKYLMLLGSCVFCESITESVKNMFLEDFARFINDNFSINPMSSEMNYLENRFSVHNIGSAYREGRIINNSDMKLMESAMYINMSINKDMYVRRLLPKYLLTSVNLRELILKNVAISESTSQYAQCVYLETLECHGCVMASITCMLPKDCSVKKIKLTNCVILKEENFDCSTLQSLEEIEVANCNLTKIPKDLFLLPRLKIAKFVGNGISKIESYNAGNKISIETLDLSSNSFDDIPIGLLAFKKLKVLNLSDNKISKGTYDFSINDKLIELDLSKNLFNLVPESINEHPSLEKLVMSLNRLVSLPYTLFNSKVLKDLDFDYNVIKEIKEQVPSVEKTISKLTGHGFDRNQTLLKFSCKYNFLDKLPAYFESLDKLRILNLSGNNFKDIPACIISMKGLKRLGLAFNMLTEDVLNNFTTIPPNLEDLDLQGGYNFKYVDTLANNISHVPRLFIDHIIAKKKDLKIFFSSITLFQDSTITGYGITHLKKICLNIYIY